MIAKLQIGLHVRESVTGNVGSDERKEYTIIGDVVEPGVKARAGDQGAHARLLISKAVRRTLDGMAGVEDLGSIELKAQPHPARVFKLV